MMRLTKIPGVWIWSGSSSPISTSCSTSATQTLPQVAIIGLKFREVFRKIRLPDLSPLQAFTSESSALMPGSSTYSLPSKTFVSLPSVSVVEKPVKRSLGVRIDFAHVERLTTDYLNASETPPSRVADAEFIGRLEFQFSNDQNARSSARRLRLLGS